MFKLRAPAILLLTPLALSGCATFNALSGSTDTQGAKSDAASYELDGDRSLRNGDAEEAMVKYLLALEARKDNPEVLYKVATLNRLDGKYDLAERGYRTVLQQREGHVGAREGLALIAIRKDNFAMAEAMLTGVLKEQPERLESINALGVMFDLQQRHADAQTQFANGLARAPGSARLLNNMGYSRYLQGDLAGSVPWFQRALDADPQYNKAWSNLGLVYTRLGREDEARRAFEQVVDRHQAINNVGYVQLLENNISGAQRSFQSAMATAPSHYATAQKNLDALDDKPDQTLRRNRQELLPESGSAPGTASVSLNPVATGVAAGGTLASVADALAGEGLPMPDVSPEAADAEAPTMPETGIEAEVAASVTTPDLAAETTVDAPTETVTAAAASMSPPEPVDAVAALSTKNDSFSIDFRTVTPAVATDSPVNVTQVPEPGSMEALPIATTLSLEEPTADPERDEQIVLVQRLLADKGYDPGPVDGVSGTRTLRAIRQFRSDTGLPDSEDIDERLMGKLRTRSSAEVRDVQRILSDKGYDPGPIDGMMGEATRMAIRQYRIDHRMPASGEIDKELMDELLD